MTFEEQLWCCRKRIAFFEGRLQETLKDEARLVLADQLSIWQEQLRVLQRAADD